MSRERTTRYVVFRMRKNEWFCSERWLYLAAVYGTGRTSSDRWHDAVRQVQEASGLHECDGRVYGAVPFARATRTQREAALSAGVTP